MVYETTTSRSVFTHVRRRASSTRSGPQGEGVVPPLTVTWNSADLQGATPVVSVSGWNVPEIDILAAMRHHCADSEG
jgi:hypothetical protein